MKFLENKKQHLYLYIIIYSNFKIGRSYRLMSNKNVCLCTNGLISWKLTAKSLWDKWYSSQNWWHICNVPCTKSLAQECLVEIQEIEIKTNFMRIDNSYKSFHSQYESINYLCNVTCADTTTVHGSPTLMSYNISNKDTQQTFYFSLLAQ